MIKDVWGAVLPKVYLKRFVKRVILKIRNPHLDRVLGTYRVVDKYLLLSKSYINSFKEIYPIEDGGQKLIAIPNPCPFADIYDGEEKKENIVLIVSRMQEDQKRIYAAIKIWSLLEEKFLSLVFKYGLSCQIKPSILKSLEQVPGRYSLKNAYGSALST